MSEQLLHLVFGGELTDISEITFKDLDKVEVVGIYPTMQRPMMRGKERRRAAWTTPRCATLSSICTG